MRRALLVIVVCAIGSSSSVRASPEQGPADVEAGAAAPAPEGTREPADAEPPAEGTEEPAAAEPPPEGAAEPADDASAVQPELRHDEPAAPISSPTREPTLVVVDLVDRGAGAELTNALSRAASDAARSAASGRVVASDELRASLDAAALEELLGCDGDGCMTRVAARLEADLVLGGSAARVLDDVVIALVVVDARSGARVAERQARVPAVLELATYEARVLTAAVLGASAPAGPVPVFVDSEPQGARVIVDGREQGATPVVVELAPGPHALLLDAGGHRPHREALIVVDGVPLALRAQLSAEPLRVWPFAVMLGGVSALAAAGGAWAGVTAAKRYDGSFALFTPDDDRASSYRYASPIDSVELAQKQQDIERLAMLANALWAVAAASAALAVVVEGADLALWATSLE